MNAGDKSHNLPLTTSHHEGILCEALFGQVFWLSRPLPAFPPRSFGKVAT